MSVLMASPQRTGREPESTEGLHSFQSATQVPFCGLLGTIWTDRQGEDMMEYALIGGMVTSIAVGIVPELFSIVQHVGEVLLSVTEACAQFAR
jgi:hypothetical protein